MMYAVHMQPMRSLTLKAQLHEDHPAQFWRPEEKLPSPPLAQIVRFEHRAHFSPSDVAWQALAATAAGAFEQPRAGCPKLTCPNRMILFVYYWCRNVESPAMEFTLGGRSNKDAARGQDAGTGSASSGGTHVRQQTGQQPQKPDVPSNWRAHNLQGTEICRKWNSSPGGCERNCPQRRARQCAICLNTHRACQHDAEKGGGNKAGKGSSGNGGQGGGPKKRARKTKKSGK